VRIDMVRPAAPTFIQRREIANESRRRGEGQSDRIRGARNGAHGGISTAVRVMVEALGSDGKVQAEWFDDGRLEHVTT
jgi:hypothetical protein